jgi:uncharacterized glyoxalase superfamily protein PhnB
VHITASAISLNVEDPVASATFAKQHLGFTEDMAVTTPIETEPWEERFFQVTDPNGVVIQLVPLKDPAPPGPTA